MFTINRSRLIAPLPPPSKYLYNLPLFNNAPLTEPLPGFLMLRLPSEQACRFHSMQDPVSLLAPRFDGFELHDLHPYHGHPHIQRCVDTSSPLRVTPSCRLAWRDLQAAKERTRWGTVVDVPE